MATNNTFVVEGVVSSIRRSIPCRDTNLMRLDLDVTDELDGKRNVVPLMAHREKCPIPEDLAVGDVVRVTFRLGGYRFAADGFGAALRIGRIDVIHRAADYGVGVDKEGGAE